MIDPRVTTTRGCSPLVFLWRWQLAESEEEAEEEEAEGEPPRRYPRSKVQVLVDRALDAYHGTAAGRPMHDEGLITKLDLCGVSEGERGAV